MINSCCFSRVSCESSSVDSFKSAVRETGCWARRIVPDSIRERSKRSAIILVKRLVDIDIGRYLANFRVPVAATVVMAIVVGFARPALDEYLSLFWTTALSVFVGAVTYLVTTMLLSPALIDKVRNVIRQRQGAATS